MEWNETLNQVNIRTCLLGLLIFILLFWFLRRPKKFKCTPGPWGWPLLGNIPQLAMMKLPSYEAITEMGHRYGPVFSFKVFNQLFVVLQDFDHTKEALDQHQLSGRPEFEISQLTNPGKGVLSAYGSPWIELRKFSSTKLRSLGMGKNTFEQQIASEAAYLLQEIRKKGAQSFDPKKILGNAVANVICFLVFGSRFEYNDVRFTGLIKAIGNSIENSGIAGVVQFLPIVSKLTFLPVVKKHIENDKAFQRMLRNLLRDHAEGYQFGVARDYTDAFRDAIEVKAQKGEQTALNSTSLFYSVSELFAAGTETMTTTFRWALLYMIAYPDIQSRVQQEMDRVVGRNRLPRWLDKPSLPYTEAVLCEIQRVAIVPLGLPHKCLQDTTVAGYHIPEGAIILINMWHILHDPNEWTNPMAFRPDRFLDSDGKFVRPEKFIPFGLGRRVCLGKHLAKMELFIIFSSLLHQFTFKTPEGADVSFKSHEGLTHSPQPFEVIAIPRE
ncbi:cytochrome P450 2U1-like [Acanthaster planci]|uniref:Cytochrome P450 2U1-like n=1 Tax=Acanthaster planci TaxID=133434 RepID=A0A8B7YPB6_ACAPL|nr:cytochrome P450 2U1-like [Acanthaster planci]